MFIKVNKDCKLQYKYSSIYTKLLIVAIILNDKIRIYYSSLITVLFYYMITSYCRSVL